MPVKSVFEEAGIDPKVIEKIEGMISSGIKRVQHFKCLRYLLSR